MRPCPKPEPRPKARKPPACKCGKPCAWYGPVGGYSVACLDCNRKNATRQREARKTWIRRKRPRRLSRAGSDPAYLAWLHVQPCILALAHACARGIQASHLRSMTGLGLKEPDRNAVPMCAELHEQWEQHRGIFRGWTKMERFAVFVQWIALVQADYTRFTGTGKLEEETPT